MSWLSSVNLYPGFQFASPGSINAATTVAANAGVPLAAADAYIQNAYSGIGSVSSYSKALGDVGAAASAQKPSLLQDFTKGLMGGFGFASPAGSAGAQAGKTGGSLLVRISIVALGAIFILGGLFLMGFDILGESGAGTVVEKVAEA